HLLAVGLHQAFRAWQLARRKPWKRHFAVLRRKLPVWWAKRRIVAIWWAKSAILPVLPAKKSGVWRFRRRRHLKGLHFVKQGSVKWLSGGRLATDRPFRRDAQARRHKMLPESPVKVQNCAILRA